MQNNTHFSEWFTFYLKYNRICMLLPHKKNILQIFLLIFYSLHIHNFRKLIFCFINLMNKEFSKKYIWNVLQIFQPIFTKSFHQSEFI